jgi:precorrin-3B synthase
MLAAMPTAPGRPTPPAPARERAGDGTAVPGGELPTRRDRDDACPGVLRTHEADDGHLARVRVPGGILTAAQAEALGEAAARLGDGDLHLTSRGNVQLRGLGAACAGPLERLLAAAGLLPSPAHERVRNIVASPLSGLDGGGHADVRPWLRALDALLCGSPTASALSGRFLFALDDGRGDVAALGPDVTLRAAPGGTALLRLGRRAPLGLPAADAPRAALLAAEAFAKAAGTPPAAWRITELPDGGAQLTDRLVERLAADLPVARLPEEPWSAGPAPRPGLIPDPADPATSSLNVLAPLGRLTAGQWRALTAVAARTPAGPSGELRLTPWRGVVVPSVPADRAPADLAALATAGLVTDAASPWTGVGACTGRPGCAKALADVRADATAATSATRPGTRPGTSGGLLPVYWSGCERACGRPRGDRVDVVATPDGYRVDRVVGGIPAAQPSSAPSDLAATVAAARRGAVSR